MTTPEAHQAAYTGMLKNLEYIEEKKLADKITVYKRGAVILFENEVYEGQWLKEPMAKNAVEVERNRPWTLPERVAYAQAYDKLLEMLEAPNRHASALEIANIKALRSEAYQEIKVENEVMLTVSQFYNEELEEFT